MPIFAKKNEQTNGSIFDKPVLGHRSIQSGYGEARQIHSRPRAGLRQLGRLAPHPPLLRDRQATRNRNGATKHLTVSPWHS